MSAYELWIIRFEALVNAERTISMMHQFGSIEQEEENIFAEQIHRFSTKVDNAYEHLSEEEKLNALQYKLSRT